MTLSNPRRYDVETLKREHPLASFLARSGLALIPAGRDTFKARCPFHEDGTPSLLVDGRDQHFHCFGCQAHGDLIDFVMRKDGVGFAEACARLANVPALPADLPRLAKSPDRERRWDRLSLDEQVVMNTAGAIYQDAIWREPRALEYVRGRGLPDRVIRECALGYADGHSLEAYLRRRSGLKVALALGLLRKPERGDSGSSLREALAGRVVVPELRGGQVIWLIGRTLTGATDRPRFLALGGERPVLGLERAAGQREAFLCEGIFDYLTAVSWQLPAFSPGGTHLPVERLGFLARTRRVWGLFDGDEAGRSAAARFAEHLGARWRALPLPEGRDLNDLGRQPNGRAEFFRMLAAARREERPAAGHRHGGESSRPREPRTPGEGGTDADRD